MQLKLTINKEGDNQDKTDVTEKRDLNVNKFQLKDINASVWCFLFYLFRKITPWMLETFIPTNQSRKLGPVAQSTIKLIQD